MDAPPGQKTPHILLLEDDTTHQELCLRAFRSDPEMYRLSVAGTIRKAREILLQDPPDLIIADWLLPDGKGLDILPRTDGKVTIPLIIMTSFGDENLAVGIMKSGAIDYVVKSATMFRELPHIARRGLRYWESIRERKRAEERLLLHSQILEMMNEGVCLTRSSDCIIVYTNSRFDTMFGYERGGLEGKHISVINAPDGIRSPECVAEEIARHLEQTGLWNGEVHNRRKDGTILWCRASVVPFVHPQFGPVWITTLWDVTDQKLAERALHESETRFRDLFNNMNSGVAIYDVADNGEDFSFADINHAAERIDNVTKEDILGRSVLDVFPGIVEFGLFAVFQRVARTGIAESHPVSLYKDNRIAGWRDNFVYKLPSGEIVSLYDDVTEKKHAEEKLQASEERLRLFIDHAPAALAMFDLEMHYIAASRRWITDYRLGDQEIIGRSHYEIFPELPESIREVHRRGLAGEVVRSDEDRFERADGTSEWLSWEMRPWYTAGHTIGGIVIFSENITARKNAEEALSESELRYRSLFENVNEGILFADIAMKKFTHANPAICRMLGYSREELLAMAVPDIHPQESLDFVLGQFEVLARGEADTVTNIPCLRKDGTIRIMEIASSRVTMQGIPNLCGFFTDITERRQAEEKLRESEEKFRTVADYTYDWEYWVSTDGNYQYVSPSCERISGYKPDDFYRDPRLMEKIIYPEDRDIFHEHADLLSSDCNREDFTEFRIISRDGGIVWIGHLCRPIHAGDGKYLGRRGSNRDITREHAAETALRESETRFRALIQNASDIIRILDKDGQVVYESASADRILGYPPGYLIGRSPAEQIHPDDQERVNHCLTDIMNRTNAGTPSEFRIRKAGGEYIWVDVIGTNLLDVPGVNGIVMTLRPIQQRKEAEQALVESEERLRLALEGAGAAFWDWDLPSGNMVFSDGFYTMLDYQPGEFPATYDGWVAHIHPDDRDRVLPDLRKQIAGKRPLCEIEYRLLSKDGHWVWVLGRGRIAATDAQGKPVRLTGVNIDITNRWLMESEIRSLNTALEQRVKDRTEALSLANAALEEENAQRLTAEKKLQASVDEKSMLLKEIHHRVKNNLQIIASLLNLQSRYVKDEQTLAAIRESQNRVKAMALVHEKLYRSEDIAHISLHEYIRFLGTGLFQFYDAKARGIQFSLDIQNVDVDIDAAIPLGLILNELISNSLKYAFPENRAGEIAISVKKEDHTLTVIFRDNGIGIPPDLDWQNTPSLGLRLVNTLVDQMNGTVELDRSAGTQFTMTVYEKQSRGQQ